MQAIMAESRKPDASQLDANAARGAAAYTPWALALYDLFVLGFSNSLVWQCPTPLLLDFYNAHISGNHLDIGVGTGYFLDRCRFPSGAPTIALLDLSPNSLAKTARRLRRFAPSCHLGNVLQPIDVGCSRFDSVALNYVLHCVPGDLRSKGVVFKHVNSLLNDGGVVFGSTILGKGIRHTLMAEKLLKIYNAKGIFSNLSDCQQDLEAGLEAQFGEYTIRIEGCVALFSGRKK